MDTDIFLAGLGLAGLGIIPTPDDVTVISPVVQILGGLALITYSFFKEDKK